MAPSVAETAQPASTGMKIKLAPQQATAGVEESALVIVCLKHGREDVIRD